MDDQWKYVPIYPGSAAYARANGELDLYRESRQAHIACKRAIEETVRENFDGMCLNEKCLPPIVEAFGQERVQYILAVTLQTMKHDGRFSTKNKKWAEETIVFPDKSEIENRNDGLIVQVHPAILDMFVKMARESFEAQKFRETPVYRHDWDYAVAHGEERLYNESQSCNYLCRDEIEKAIANHHDGYRLSDEAPKAVLKRFGQDRTFFVLANTVQIYRDDGRISRQNIKWADETVIPPEAMVNDPYRRYYIVKSHCGLVDLFTKMAIREAREETRKPLSEQLRQAKATVPAVKMPEKKKKEAAR